MRSVRYFLPLAVVVLGISVVGFAQSKDEVRLSIVKEVMNEIAHDQFVSVVERFSPDLKDSVTQDQIKAQMDELVAVTGAFQKQLSQETRTVKGMPIYVSRSQFEKFKVELGLSFDDGNRITDLWIAPVSDLSPDSMETSAKAITDLLSQKNFDQLTSQFNDRMKAAMPTEHLDASWSHIILHLGQFKSVKLARKNPEFDFVDVRCEFERGEITVRVAFDLFGKVDGLWMLPVEEDDIPGEKAGLSPALDPALGGLQTDNT